MNCLLFYICFVILNLLLFIRGYYVLKCVNEFSSTSVCVHCSSIVLNDKIQKAIAILYQILFLISNCKLY